MYDIIKNVYTETSVNGNGLMSKNCGAGVLIDDGSVSSVMYAEYIALKLSSKTIR